MVTRTRHCCHNGKPLAGESVFKCYPGFAGKTLRSPDRDGIGKAERAAAGSAVVRGSQGGGEDARSMAVSVAGVVDRGTAPEEVEAEPG